MAVSAAGAGRSPRQGDRLPGRHASLYLGAYAFEETLGLASPTGEELPPAQIVAMFRDYLLSLPADRFPHVHRAIDHIFGGDADERFEFGIDVILRGIETYARLAGPDLQ